MKNISSIINDIKSGADELIRIQYMPYSTTIAKQVWKGIAQKLIGKIDMQPTVKQVWTELIKWVHADESCGYDLKKSILIMGRTGSGKSKTIQILKQYIAIDQVRYFRNGKRIPLDFHIYNAREIVADFQNGGYDAIAKYTIYANICIDDIGTESAEAVHYGTRLKVIPEIIETRYSKCLMTHFTSNLDLDSIRERYDDRVYSRISEKCNHIYLNDKDFRTE